jgi:hypothetical protein
MENDPTGTVANASAEIATCTYDTGRAADPFVAIRVRCCPCGDNDPDAAPQAYAVAGTTVTAVDGVGESAFWIETSPEAGVLLFDQLVVFVGADLEVVVSLSVPLGQVFTFDPLAAAKRMATAALPRL